MPSINEPEVDVPVKVTLPVVVMFCALGLVIPAAEALVPVMDPPNAPALMVNAPLTVILVPVAAISPGSQDFA